MPRPAPGRGLLFITALALLGSLGCAAATPYRYGHFRAAGEERPNDAITIERGAPNKTLDRLAWIVGTLARILPLNSKINRHELSDATAAKLTDYLVKNDLTDVYVYVNHYDPKGQWRRLRQNALVSPLWRYSFGVVSFVGYTLLPNRILGGDSYNPFTNSLYLNSDVPAIALHEAAYAKDVHARRFPGLYAAINDLPVLTLWHHSRAVSDVLGYAQAEHDWMTERQTYCVVYPQVGAQSATVATPLVDLWWSGLVLRLGGAAVGHLTGRAQANAREGEIESLAALPPKEGEVRQASYVEGEDDGEQVVTLDKAAKDMNGGKKQRWLR